MMQHDDAAGYYEERVDSDRPYYQYISAPLWLKFSRIADLWPGSLATSCVFYALVEWDLKLIGLPGRRSGEDGWTFSVSNADVARLAHVRDTKLVGKVAQEVLLDELGLLQEYRRGTGTRQSEYRFSLQALQDLFCYVAPRLPKMLGGIRTADGDQDGALRRPRVIYGILGRDETWPEPVVIPASEMLELWRKRPRPPEDPDPKELRRILETRRR